MIGARTEEQLIDNLAAATLRLTADELGRLERVSRPPLLYPYWHQAAEAPDRLSGPDRALLGPHLVESPQERAVVGAYAWIGVSRIAATSSATRIGFEM